ncbi:permease for cytosine/purines, uracil, thiamine, allantoin-domain-containing protein [Leptodontidium sp. MPI-SDFR-AT-0119]|nr:permease for cytosine/purines, uracil, thiamine, allantoin-domain-containing protein [Leptodontidium sp. MPI-SDFR-AT-0119]
MASQAPAGGSPSSGSPDPEKGLAIEPETTSTSPSSIVLPSTQQPQISLPPAIVKFNEKIESLAGLESRGITRVLPSERHGESLLGDLQMAFLWFSANLTANNLAVGFLGPLVFELGFVDSALCAVFGAFVGCILTAYMSIWGAQSGNRTMVVARFFMGYWPSKICCLLNIVIMVGYGLIDCVIGGQMLSAVSGGSMSIVVGIIIVALISLVVAVFGMALFHAYERWAWIPQLIVLFILVGSAGPKFDSTLPSVGSASAIAANRLSFFSLSLSVPVSWAAASSDFYVYYPETTAKWKSFILTLTGLFLSFTIVNLLGVGLASGISKDAEWSAAYDISSGALILAGYDGLAGFGKFCGVIVALGVIANNIPGTYSAALGFQMLGRYPKAVPRYWWTIVVVAIYFVCAIIGRDHLFTIFQNFLALMGYWVTVFVSIVFEEHLFKWKSGFDWSAWEDPKRLPVGYAALTAFLVGWAGCIISMYQVYYVGPIAALVGDAGADLGIWVGCGFALVTYPPLRLLELKLVGR